MSQAQIDELQQHRNLDLPEDTIFGFFNEYRFLSNFHVVPVEYAGLTYTSTEAAYMSAKTLDEVTKRRFTLLSPKDAKALGRRITMCPGWDAMRVQVMYDVNVIKYKQPDLRQLLLATEQRILVEANWWNDTFWGMCRGVGQNRLGNVLMLIRHQIQQGVI